jgi:solute carrier family 25 (mitochondrial 2-oxodicarboxylate transporter), member 21
MGVKTGERPLPFWMQFVAGGTAGVSEIMVMYPLDVVKTRFQLQVGSSSLSTINHTSIERYTSIIDCFQKIIQHEG